MKRSPKIIFLYLLFLGVFLGATAYYYGDILPNSFYRKSTNTDLFDMNFEHYKEFFVVYVLPLFVWAGIIIYLKKQIVVPELRILIFVVGLTVYYLYSNLEMNYSYRFFYHTYPLFLVMVGLFVEGVINKKVSTKKKGKK